MNRLIAGAVACVALVLVMLWALRSDEHDSARPVGLATTSAEGASQASVDELQPSERSNEPPAGATQREATAVAATPAPAPPTFDVRGRVVDALGNAVESFGLRGIRRDARNAFAEERIWAETQHLGGEFVLEGLEPTVWEIAPFAEGFDKARPHRFLRSNANAAKFVLPATVRLEGVVRDSAGAAVAGATVRAERVWSAEEEVWGRFVSASQRSTTSDATGQFALTMASGVVHVHAEHEQFADGSPIALELSPLEPTAFAELRVPPACRLGVHLPRGSSNDRFTAYAGRASSFDLRRSREQIDDIAWFDRLPDGWNVVKVTRFQIAVGYEVFYAAVELEPGKPLEIEFSLSELREITVRWLDLSSPSRNTGLWCNAMVYPTLPNLNWTPAMDESTLALGIGGLDHPSGKRSGGAWIAPAPGSYVIFPRACVLPPNGPTPADLAAAFRFEVPEATYVDVELPPNPRSR